MVSQVKVLVPVSKGLEGSLQTQGQASISTWPALVLSAFISGLQWEWDVSALSEEFAVQRNCANSVGIFEEM